MCFASVASFVEVFRGGCDSNILQAVGTEDHKLQSGVKCITPLINAGTVSTNTKLIQMHYINRDHLDTHCDFKKFCMVG